MESAEVKGVNQSWALEVRSFRDNLNQATEEQLAEDRAKIRSITGEYKPDLQKSVCEWAELLQHSEIVKANNYGRWEVVGNIRKVGDGLTTAFYKSLLKQLNNLAQSKIPELTEEEKEKELEGTLQEAKVCSEGCQFSKLQKAISAAKPGGVITVEAGTYHENLTIEKDVTIRGNDRTGVQLQGEKTGHPVLAGGKSANVKLMNLSVEYARESEGKEKCSNEAIGVCPNGITVRSRAHLELNNVSIDGNRVGIGLLDTARVTLRGTSITRSTSYALELKGNSRVEVFDSTLSGGNTGIYLLDFAVAEIQNSKMEVFGNGFFLWDGSEAVVKNCQLVRMDFGAYLDNRSKITLKNNKVIDVEMLTFSSPLSFSGEIITLDNDITQEETALDEAKQAPQLEILGWEVSRGQDWVWVSGSARNISGEQLIIAEVVAIFYDSADNEIYRMPATTLGLDDGEVWEYEVSAFVSPTEVDHVEVIEGESTGI